MKLKLWLSTWQLNRPSEIHHHVIPVTTGIQTLLHLFWIPALRSATAGMTGLVAGQIKKEDSITKKLSTRHLLYNRY
jgi:hypothetical protein